MWYCMYVHTHIGGWGGESFVTPTGKSFRFVRSCERARRGEAKPGYEAVWASERRFDCAARAVVRPVYLLLLLSGKTMRGGLSAKNIVCTMVLLGCSRTTFVKPVYKHICSRTTL